MVFRVKLIDIQQKMSQDQFYLTIPSNTPFPNNTTSSFRVKLPKRIELNGEWEVGLAEIQYPLSWNNVNASRNGDEDLENIFKVYLQPGIAENNTIYVSIPPSYYNNINELIMGVSKSLEKIEIKKNKLYNNAKDEYYTLASCITITYAYLSKRVEIQLNKHVVKGLVLGTHLQYLFGFDGGWLTLLESSENIAKYPPDLSAGINTLYIYFDIIQPQIVGNILAPLLRTVAVKKGEYGDTVDKIYFSPHYLPLRSRNFDSIEIQIKNDTDQLIPFKFGKAILKIHFKLKE